MKKKLLAGLAVGVMIQLAVAGVADATLISQDLSSSGDNLITFDSETGLEWLDLTATYGMSYLDAVSSFSNQNFRPVYGGEVSQLFADAGIIDDVYSTVVTYAASNFVSIIDPNNPSYQPVGFSSDLQLHGLLAGGTLTAGIESWTMPGNFEQNLYLIDYDGLYNSIARGTWLVREQPLTPTPEPATMLLMGTGLAGLIGAHMKKKK